MLACSVNTWLFAPRLYVKHCTAYALLHESGPSAGGQHIKPMLPTPTPSAAVQGIYPVSHRPTHQCTYFQKGPQLTARHTAPPYPAPDPPPDPQFTSMHPLLRTTPAPGSVRTAGVQVPACQHARSGSAPLGALTRGLHHPAQSRPRERARVVPTASLDRPDVWREAGGQLRGSCQECVPGPGRPTAAAHAWRVPGRAGLPAVP